MTRESSASPLRAGALYFAAVFAAGFALGTVRTLWFAPHVGDLAAVALELPVMLALAWWVCGRLVPIAGPALQDRAAMGIIGFALLIVAEAALAVGLGATLAGFLAGLAQPAGALGLAGQVAFAFFPLICRRPASN